MMRSQEIDRTEIRRLSANGMSINAIASKLGCGRATVWRAINGDKPASGAHAKKCDPVQLLALWQQGLTLIQIGAAIGCSASTAGMLVKQHGLPPREQLRKMPLDDPTPDEIERLKAELKARHMEERRAESPCNTHSKVSKWRQNICQPRGLA